MKPSMRTIEPRKSKILKESSFTSIPKISKKKPTKRTSSEDEELRNEIVRLLMVLNKEEISSKDLQWVLLNLYYSRLQIEQMMTEYAAATDRHQQDVYYPADVYEICQKYPQSGRWRRECFDSFSKNKKSVTLQDLEAVWDLANKNKKSIVSHQNLIELVKMYGLETEGAISFEQFDNLLKQCNPFI